MPVYGKGRTQRNGQRYTPQMARFIRLKKTIDKKKSPKRMKWEFIPQEGKEWDYDRTSAWNLEKNLRFPIRQWSKERFAKTNRPVRILEFGSGTADALQEIQKELGDRAVCVGYGVDRYAHYPKMEHVPIIVQEHQPALRYFRRIAGKEGLDLVISRYGLFHLYRQRGLAYMDAYIAKLAGMLAMGGVIVNYPVQPNRGPRLDIQKVEADLRKQLDKLPGKFTLAVSDRKIQIERTH